MRQALRRALWIIPTLFVVSLAAFWALSRAAGSPTATKPPGATHVHPEPVRLPLFFNPKPRNVRDLAHQAAQGVARGGDQAGACARLLARLGGAALPHVLPHLDSLAPTERARVALSLAPVGARMRVGSRDELQDPHGAVLFWHRFWEDHSIDFRHAVVKRSVRRVTQRATPGRVQDIVQLDTFALPELIDAMGIVSGLQDVPRIVRLTQLAGHVTGLDWQVAEHASVAETRSIVARWQHWWRQNGSEYTVFDGPQRLSAMVVETAYGKWLGEAVRGNLGTTVEGRPVLAVLRQRAPVTLWLIAWALIGGYAFGVALGMVEATRTNSPLGAMSAAATVLLVALPLTSLAALTAPVVPASGSAAGAALVMLLVTLALVSRFQRATARSILNHEHCIALRALGASRRRVAVRCLKNSSLDTASLLGVHLPALLTAAFVAERAFGLAGLGEVSLEAMHRPDVSWLMALALATVVVVALAQLGSDLVLASLDPRVRTRLAQGRGGRR